MIFRNLPRKTKGTFVKQYRKLVQPTARLFLGKLRRPPKSLDPRILGTRGGPVREEINLKVAGGYFGGENHRALQGAGWILGLGTPGASPRAVLTPLSTPAFNPPGRAGVKGAEPPCSSN